MTTEFSDTQIEETIAEFCKGHEVRRGDDIDEYKAARMILELRSRLQRYETTQRTYYDVEKRAYKAEQERDAALVLNEALTAHAAKWGPRVEPADGKAQLKLYTYSILAAAVERGVENGYRRAFKHTDTPGPTEITNCIHDNVMLELGEVVDFGNAD